MKTRHPKHLAVVCLSLLLVVPAAGVDPPFDNEIKAFEQSDQTAPPPREGILFVGSSSIRLWKTLAEDFPAMPVINRGFGGSHVEDSLRYADRIILPYHPKVIVFYAGDNDIAAGKSPQRVCNDFAALTEKIHASLPETRIIYISIKPSVARWHLFGRVWLTNQLIRDFTSKDKRMDFLDVSPPMLGPDGRPRRELFVQDGLHLNADGYRIWVDLLRPHLDQALGKN